MNQPYVGSGKNDDTTNNPGQPGSVYMPCSTIKDSTEYDDCLSQMIRIIKKQKELLEKQSKLVTKLLMRK